MGYRAQLPRYQGPPFRHGPRRHAHWRTDAPRPSAADQRLRHGAANHARRGRRKSRHGPVAQIQHVEAAHALVVPPRLHALRTHPQHARAPARAAHATLRRDRRAMRRVQRYFRGRMKMRGLESINATILSNENILLPRSVSEQVAIVRKLDELSSETQRVQGIYQQKLASLRELKQAILQKAFAGELAARAVEAVQEAAE